MILRCIRSTKTILFDRETSNSNSLKSYFGAFLCVLSVAILFVDKFTTFGITNTYGYRTPETFIWMIAQSVSPIILCMAAFLKAQRIFYFLPIYVYFIQTYWSFDSSLKADDPILHLYAIGFSIGVFAFLCLTLIIIKSITKTNQKLVGNLKKSVRHIVVFISEKYIDKLPEDDKKDYTVDTVKYIDSLD